MSTAEILREATSWGIILEPDGNSLHYRAPKGSLMPTLREALTQHKAEVLSVLQSRNSGTGKGLCSSPEECKGCYQVGTRADGSPIYMHPPKGKPID